MLSYFLSNSPGECYRDMEVSEKLIEFVRKHESEDTSSLRLRYAGTKANAFDFDLEFALIQIEARRKTRQKIPVFLAHQNFVFPTLLSAEQASNEVVAKFHAKLIEGSQSLLDLTAGLGIDDISMAKTGVSVTACEIDQIKCEALVHNAKVMGVSEQISVVNEDSIEYVKNQKKSFDVVYADPARRNSSGVKVHALSDCQPDILASMDEILSISPRLLVKSSPLLDLTLIRKTVKDLNHIFVICHKGECKEVLIDIKKDSCCEGVTVVDLEREGEISRFHTDFKVIDSLSKEAFSRRRNVTDFKYLYEPNAGVMKTGAWKTLIDKYPDLLKADKNTHVFLSNTLYADFPGRVMSILSEPDKKALKRIKGTKINIVSRNHPLSAPQIANKYSVTSGSDKFLYAFRHNNIPTFIIAEPIK